MTGSFDFLEWLTCPDCGADAKSLRATTRKNATEETRVIEDGLKVECFNGHTETLVLHESRD